jgi:hypothetical protein
MQYTTQSVLPLPKLTAMETLRGFEVCPICGAKYQWSPDGDCPNRCRSKAQVGEDEQERLIVAQAEHLVLLRKLEAIGYCGEQLEAKAREIQADIIAASFIPRPLVPPIVPITAGTIAKGVILANLLITGIVFLLILFIKVLS